MPSATCWARRARSRMQQLEVWLNDSSWKLAVHTVTPRVQLRLQLHLTRLVTPCCCMLSRNKPWRSQKAPSRRRAAAMTWHLTCGACAPHTAPCEEDFSLVPSVLQLHALFLAIPVQDRKRACAPSIRPPAIVWARLNAAHVPLVPAGATGEHYRPRCRRRGEWGLLGHPLPRPLGAAVVALLCALFLARKPAGRWRDARKLAVPHVVGTFICAVV